MERATFVVGSVSLAVNDKIPVNTKVWIIKLNWLVFCSIFPAVEPEVVICSIASEAKLVLDYKGY